MAKVECHIADGSGKGARLACGSARLDGRFLLPMILTEVTFAMIVAREETFGALAPLFRFETEQKVIAAVNDTEFGLASYYVYTRDNSRVWRMMEALDYGMVGVNTGLISTEIAPFGGVKSSGLGREGSRHGLDDYLEMKYVCLAGI
jgi:succinate-semialdehyde dehydrogenase/glutarate-semialdehyde dehydrogenase